jgi:hypothetical protein
MLDFTTKDFGYMADEKCFVQEASTLDLPVNTNMRRPIRITNEKTGVRTVFKFDDIIEHNREIGGWDYKFHSTTDLDADISDVTVTIFND